MPGDELNITQVNAITDIATNFANPEFSENPIEGDSTALFEDFNTSLNSQTQEDSQNSELYSYIDKIMGASNFIALVGTDNQISTEALDDLANYDHDAKLTSKDIDLLVQDALEAAPIYMDEAQKSDKNDEKSDSTSLSSSTTEQKQDTEEFKYEYDSDGNLKSMYDVKKKCTTNYNYENGKLKTSETTTKDENGNSVTMNTCTYNDLGQIESKHELISEETGLKGDYFHLYTYDDQGRIATAKLYNGDSQFGTQIGDYTYEYDGDSIYPSSRTNIIGQKSGDGTIETTYYTYDADHNVVSTKMIITDESGNTKTTSECEYNADGTIKSMTQDGVVHEYTYENGIRTQEDIKGGDDKTPNKIYYQGGKMTAQVVGDKTYVYEEVDGKQVKNVYKTEDCPNGVPKVGVEPIANYNFYDRSNGMPSISYSDLLNGLRDGSIDSSAGDRLGSIADATGTEMNTMLRCNWGVSNSIWNTYGLTENDFMIPTGGEFNDTLESNPVGEHFIKIDISDAVKNGTFDLTTLPAGTCLCWEQEGALGNGLYGHCSISLGDGRESSDHVIDQYIYDPNEIGLSVYYPIS